VPSPKPLPRYPRTIAPKKIQPDYHGFAQRNWLKIFLLGLCACGYGTLEFFAGKAEYPNIFDDPRFAGYWIFLGLLAMFVGLSLRAWVGE